MSITKRTFLIICCIISAILLTLNGATYLLFRASITQQLITSQEAIIEANVRLSGIFTQTVDQLVYRYTSDQQLGELLGRDIGQDELRDLNTKFALNNRLIYQQNAEPLLLNNGFRAELYVNPALEVSQLFLPSSTIPEVSRVYSGAMVEQEDWYQAALQRRSGQHIFLNKDQTRLCFARRLQSSTFTGAYQKDGMGVLLGSLPVNQISRLLSLVPVTRHSGFLLLNDQGDQIYRSANLSELSIADALLIPNSVSSELNIGGQEYLCTSQKLEWGIQLVFLTPYRDITSQVWSMMFPYLLCSVIFMLVGILFSLMLSAGISRPVVQFTKKLETIRDTRGVEWNPADIRGPREIQQLSSSFGSLIDRINTLIQELTAKEKLRRESELKALQAQINPHFMLNAMNAVNYMALAREEDDIAATVDSIASLMRYSITEPDRMVTMSTELENIREYISVYVLRFQQDIRLEILPGLHPAQVVIPKFTLQPLVENSIRHGITRQDPGITIRIRAREENGLLIVEVTDTGRGGDAALLNAYLDYQDVQLQVTHGFGIRNVNERLMLRFGQRGGLRYFNYDGRQLLARLTLPSECDAASDGWP